MKKNFNGYVNREELNENNKALVSKINTDIINLLQQYDDYIKKYMHQLLLKNVNNKENTKSD